MATSFGGSVKLTGESEYRKALREITTNLKEVSSELKLTNTQFTSGDKTIKETKSSYNNMSTALSQQREKVNSLRSALQEAEKEYGANNDKVKTFKTQLNNAESELIKMENETDKNNKELKEMKENFDNAGQSGLKFGDILKANVIGDVIVSGIKAVGSAIKEIGSGLINIGKSAVESYADYEQLIGGVETLFKDSAGIVEDYANNAYKTAGLSANDYMETVTSFSASLLQSLNNDTAKSAEVADMAITDMSDNANKMGTSMESIQNAYQGFAKQNYTMLDNLKLGYGGTKSEMERLLADAEKVSGVKYDISNLSDVYNAIHVIQGELGITGTTAKEASTTIQGSISSLKSSWSNLLTGIADDDADWDTLVSNFFDSIFVAADNLLPRVGTAVWGIIALIRDTATELLPEIVEMGSELIVDLAHDIVENLPVIMESIMQVGNTIIDTLISLLPEILQMGITILTSLIEGIAQSLPELIPQAIEAIITIVEGLLDNIDSLIDAGIELIMGLAEGLIEALPILIEKAPEIISKLCDAFVRNFPQIISAGGELLGKLASGITGSIWKLLEVAPQLISSIVNGLKNGLSEILNVGQYLVEGLWNGISGMANWVKEKITGFASNIVGNIKEALGIHSPSTIFRDEVGKFMAQGIGVGFSDEMNNVADEMKSSIPTQFDVTSSLTGTENNDNSINLKEALIEAFKEFKPRIILNEKDIGEFAFEYGNTKFGSYY